MTSTYQEQKMARALEAIDKKGNMRCFSCQVR